MTEPAVDEHGLAALSSIFFNERGALITARLGDVIRDNLKLKHGTDGRLWAYRHGVYQPSGAQGARQAVREALGDRVRKSHFAEVEAYLSSFAYELNPDSPQTKWVNVRNGLVDWRTGEMRAHTPDIITTNQLPIAYDLQAKAPRLEQFFAEVFPADAAGLAAEILGYALYPGNPYRKAVLLLGPGGDGKSVYLDVATSMLGTSNVANEPLQRLAESRFAPAELYGKLANICGDLDARAVRQSDYFKILTGGDRVSAERKYSQSFTFTNHALLVFSANEAPISSDQTHAWFSRWLILPMERHFDAPDSQLRPKLTTPEALSGSLNLALDGLRRLMLRGRFEEPSSVRRAGDIYRDKLDTARGFVNEECEFAEKAWTPRAAVYKSYRRWCADSGRMPVSAENFYTRLTDDHPDLAATKRRGIRGFSGITLPHETAPHPVDNGPDDPEEASNLPPAPQECPQEELL